MLLLTAMPKNMQIIKLLFSQYNIAPLLISNKMIAEIDNIWWNKM